MQITDKAIDQSKNHNEIVTITALDMRRAGVSVDAVLAELFSECEGDVENGAVHEYWGEDVDGNEWRVHVQVAS